jgi:dTDP-4-dehydrorhamnose 3,5-epimerase
MISLNPTSLEGCYELIPKVLNDERGKFVKTIHCDRFKALGLQSDFREQYYSTSHRRVLRGLHFQLPPREHAKLVYCIAGSVMDVAVDLRRHSPTYGQFVCVELCAEQGSMVYLAPGLAHGFYTRSESATLVYNVTSTYAREQDAGIRWDSVGIPWPDDAPILSPRDLGFQTLAEFQSPFTLETESSLRVPA